MRGENIKATYRHDKGAVARCSYCLRYSDNPRALDQNFPCDCGRRHGWSGSFVSPDSASKWSEAKL